MYGRAKTMRVARCAKDGNRKDGEMVRLVVAYVVSLLIFLLIDGVIIFSFGAKLYKSTLGDVIADSFRLAPIVLFYLVFTFGLCYFAVAPALQEHRWQIAAVRGAVYGLSTYATYALTCYAAIRNWTLQLAATDLTGGTILASVVAVTAYFITARF
jgi:uncharacterized membrane protein